MDILTLTQVSSWASIISLFFSLWAVLTVRGMKTVLREKSMDSHFRELIKRIQAIPLAKKILSTTHRSDTTSLIRILDSFYTSALPWRDREIKKLKKSLITTLAGNPSVQEVKDIVNAIESQTLQTARI